MPYTSMPAWPSLSDQEVSDLAYSLQPSLPTSRRRECSHARRVSERAGRHEESIELGKKLYEENGCLKCHGNLGRGDGPSAPTLADDFGHPIRAADLSQRWTFRGGSSREDIFRTMSTGLNGTPMPSFADALQPEQRWAMPGFIASCPGVMGLPIPTSSSPEYLLDSIDCRRGRRASSPPVWRAFRSSDRLWSPGARSTPSRHERDGSGHLRR